jgi:hypothetical protein
LTLPARRERQTSACSDKKHNRDVLCHARGRHAARFGTDDLHKSGCSPLIRGTTTTGEPRNQSRGPGGSVHGRSRNQ